MLRPIPGIPLEQQPSNVLARMLVYGEARGESVIGQLAVLAVAMNRAARKGVTLKDVILKPFAFSSFNHDDPNRDKLLSAYVSDPLTWAAIDALCSLYETGTIPDPSRGADHYYRDDLQPPWGRGNSAWRDTVVIGHHIFGSCP